MITRTAILRVWAVQLVLGSLLLTGCAKKVAPTRTIAVTIPAIGPLIASLVGSEAAITIVLPPGASPHAFEPRPSLVRQVASAELLITVDPEIDGFAPKGTGTPRLVLTDLLKDPPDNRHIWLDPVLMAEVIPQLAESICSGTSLDCQVVRRRSVDLQEELLRLSGDMLRHLAPVRESYWVVSGPFLEPFFQRFTLREALILEPVEGVEPTPSSIRDAIDLARRGASVVGQTRLPEQASRMVSIEGRTALILVDPIGTADAPVEYATFMMAIADSLLSGRTID